MTIIANASTVCQTLSALHILIHLIQQFNDGSPVLYFSNKGTEAEMGQTTPDCIANRWWSQNASFKSQNCHMTQHDLAIPLLGIHTEETRTERDTCTPMFIAALFIIARTWKQPRCPSADEWIRKLWYIYTMEYYSAIKKNTFESVLMRWMKLELIIRSEVSQKEKHQYRILTHIYGIQKDGNDNPVYKIAKETQMYKQSFGLCGRG